MSGGGASAAALRRLLARERAGVLATLSVHLPGHPFGSVTPYALSPRREPLLVLSDLAEHTRNLRADPRASLLVSERAAWDDPQRGARATLLGRLEELQGEQALRDARARWEARLPAGRSQLWSADFRVYTLVLEAARFIAGFGAMRWVPAEELLHDPAKDPLAAHAAEALEHMNRDHPAALAVYLEAFRSVTTGDARMVSLDAWGFDLESASAGRFRFDFDEAVATPEDLRSALVELVRRGRARLAPPSP